MKKIFLLSFLMLGILVNVVIADNVDVLLDTTDGSSGLVVKSSDATKIATIDSSGGITATGISYTGPTLTLGPGTRLMWYPKKFAFRAGEVTGTQWDDANIGYGSVAMGYNSSASTQFSTAMGQAATSSGNTSTALGFNTRATAAFATAIGDNTWASSQDSTAMGDHTTASATGAVAMGSYLNNWYSYSLGIGDGGIDFLFNPNGNSWLNPASGNVGIGTTNPKAKLDIFGNVSVEGNSYLKGNVGIGTTSPTAKLDVNSTTSGVIGVNVQANGTYAGYFNGSGFGSYGVYGKGNMAGGSFESDASGTKAVYGRHSLITGTNYGGYFQSDSQTGYGVYGLTSNTTGTNYGGYFQSNSSSGRGVQGVASSTTGTNYGGYFQSYGASSASAGVYGRALTTEGTTYGGEFISDSSSGIGVGGWATHGSGVNYGGSFGTNSPKGWAGYFYGKVGISGSLEVASALASKIGGGSWNTPSDARLKNIIGDYNLGLNQILNLNPVRYEYKKDNPLKIPTGQQFVGLIAQNVQKFIPEAISEGKNGYLSLNADPVLWAMLNAIKEQQAMIKSQTTEINDLKARMKTLEGKIK